MASLRLGVPARSLKENEHRLPLHPDHLSRIPAELRGQIYLENGYGARFGASDAELRSLVGGLRTREQLVEECHVLLQPKPMVGDLACTSRSPASV